MTTVIEIKTYDDIENEYAPSLNKSSNIMTVYEKTNIIGLRLEQLAMGAPSLLDDETLKKCNSIKEVAQEELERKLLPYMIRRNLGNNVKEYWKLRDMFIP